MQASNAKINPLPVINKSIKKNVKKNYKLGELFCGAGGFALGASMANWQGNSFHHVWAIDNNQDACETFRNNIHISKKKVICQNVELLDFNKLDSIDGLLFGFPCNDFSIVGEHKGLNGIYGNLYSYGVHALRHFKPLFFVAENVGGLQTANNKSAMPIIEESFVKEGYTVSSHLYKFEEYGVPQRRRRIIFIGFRKDLHIKYTIPSPQKKMITVKEAIQDIPKNADNHEYTKQHPRVVERLKYIKPGENVFTADLPKHLRLNMKSDAKISQIYKRLRPNSLSYTITGSGGGGTHVYHWKEPRALTNRERARLQTFPDSFVFKGAKESVRKQIGMAIPPKGIAVILKQILKTLYEFNI